MSGYRADAGWLATSGRLTIFAPSVQTLRLKPWKDLFGVNPSFMSTDHSSGQEQEIGPFQANGCQLVIAKDMGRADAVLTPVVQPNTESVIFSIGDIDRSLGLLDKLFDLWIRETEGIVRFAVGLQVVERASSVSEACKTIAESVPLAGFDGTEEDFLLQINRPIQSLALPGLTLNRVTQWQTVAIGQAPVAPTPFAMPLMPPAISAFAASCTIDVNTRPIATPLGNIGDLYQEMRTLIKGLVKEKRSDDSAANSEPSDEHDNVIA